MQKRFTPDAGGVFPEWEEVTLGDIAEFSRGKELTKKDVSEKGERKCLLYGQLQVRYGTIIKNVTGMTDVELKNPVLSKSGDVLISGTISAGLAKASCIKEDGVIIGGDINILRPKEGIDGEFLARAINANTKKFKRFLEGSVILHLKNENIKEVSIRIPKSIEEQRKIAAAFAAYDEMIAVKTAKLETWQECKKRMVKEIFGRTKRFKDDDGREFPEWEEKTLEEISEPLKYGMSAAAVKYDGENKYLRITDIDEASRKYVSDKIVSPEASKIAEKFLVQKNDLLFARTGASVGKTYLYDEADGKMYYAGYLMKAHIKPEYDSQFIFQLTLTDEFKKWIKKESMRTAQPGINAECLAKYKMMIPCMEEQQKIGSFLAEIDKEIQIQKEFIKTYAEGKKRMMRELMEG